MSGYTESGTNTQSNGVSPPFHINDVQSSDRGLIVRWGDGHTSRYPTIALRHQCECEFCGTSENGVRGVRIRAIPEDIRVSRMRFGDSQMTIDWSDGHRSAYAAQWLRNHCSSSTERAARKHVPLLWDATLADSLPLVDFEEVERSAEARLNMLLNVCDYGVCKIVNAPIAADQSSRMINLVGPQRITNHGTFVLSGKKAVDNVGDTTMALDPHTDEPYRLSAIGITVFQVLRPASVGGDTTLVDGFEAARRLRETAPAEFDLLSSVPITCHRIEAGRNEGREQRHYASRRRVIQLDSDGEVVGFRLNERQITPMDMPENLIESCYRALRRILQIVYSPDMTLQLKLEAGEGLLFNNQRILHGRTEFVAENPPKRSVLTSSVDLDDFYSTIRMLRAELDASTRPSNFGQGMAG